MGFSRLTGLVLKLIKVKEWMKGCKLGKKAMGLDTVELITDTEAFFNISIPNIEAEHCSTVGELTACVCRHLALQEGPSVLQQNWMELLRTIIPAGGTEPVAAWVACDDKAMFERIGAVMGMHVFLPEKRHRLYKWEELTTDQFLLAILAANFRQVVHVADSVYAVRVAVTGITAEKAGEDCYAIRPEDSFTSDLGLD